MPPAILQNMVTAGYDNNYFNMIVNIVYAAPGCTAAAPSSRHYIIYLDETGIISKYLYQIHMKLT